jgi:hypothetical protein
MRSGNEIGRWKREWRKQVRGRWKQNKVAKNRMYFLSVAFFRLPAFATEQLCWYGLILSGLHFTVGQTVSGKSSGTSIQINDCSAPWGLTYIILSHIGYDLFDDDSRLPGPPSPSHQVAGEGVRVTSCGDRSNFAKQERICLYFSRSRGGPGPNFNWAVQP